MKPAVCYSVLPAKIRNARDHSAKQKLLLAPKIRSGNLGDNQSLERKISRKRIPSSRERRFGIPQDWQTLDGFCFKKAHFQAGPAYRVGKLLLYEGGCARVGAFQRRVNVSWSSRVAYSQVRDCYLASGEDHVA